MRPTKVPGASRRRLFLLALLLGTLGVIPEAIGQIYVVPRRAGKSNLRSFDFEWRYVDLMRNQRLELPHLALLPHEEGPHARDPNVSGGIRMYFYDREEQIAERAAAQIVSAYKDLAESFEFVPPARLPYVLYSSYQEFLQTNLFPVQEGILGVTSTEDLTLTLPYFGDYRLFREVSRHEMAHQFTIQKAEALGGGGFGDPMAAFPLWFSEGLAELYAHRGLDPETEMIAHDLELESDVERGYGMLDFFEDRPGSVLWTYKLGQVRCAFLEEAYGRGTVQRLIATLSMAPRGLLSRRTDEALPAVIELVTHEPHEKTSARFRAWLRGRAIGAYLRARQSPAILQALRGYRRPSTESIMQSLRTSPSGELLMYRRIDGTTGETSLVLLDFRAPDDDEKIASDGKPGIESLHPVYDQTFDVSDDALTFVAESSGRDLLYFQTIKRHTKRTIRELPELDQLEHPYSSHELALRRAEHAKTTTTTWSVDFTLGPRVRYDLSAHGLIAAFSPALSPDGTAIAFVGLDPRGERDVYVLRGAGQKEHTVTRLTHDPFSERGLDWGPLGIVYASDATDHGHFNLFLVDPETSSVKQITDEPRDHFSPAALPDGGIVFLAYRDGRSNVYELTYRGVIQRTDLPTGLFDVGPGLDSGLWALQYRSGARRPVRIDAKDMLTLEPDDAPETTLPGGMLAPPTRSLASTITQTSSTATTALARTSTLTPGLQKPLPPEALALRTPTDYGLLELSNWTLNNIFAIFGAGGGGVFGRAIAAFSDRLRLNGLLVDISAFGAFELTEGVVLYVNEANRATWGFGPFQSLQFRLDPTFGNAVDRFFSAERFYGGLGILRYPLDRFLNVQLQLAIGGTGFVIDHAVRDYLGSIPSATGAGSYLDDWRRQNDMHDFQTELTASIGYDTIRYHPRSGPIAGRSLLLEASAAVQPVGDELWGSSRFDAQQFLHVGGRSAIMLRLGVGTIFGGLNRRQYFLSSFDTLRGVPFGDLGFLLGSKFLYSTAELRVPLDEIIGLAFLSSVDGVAGVDFGGVGDSARLAWDRRVLDFALGVNFGLGPLLLRLHFARAVDVGAPLPVTSGTRWVTNFSLGWLYF